MIIGIRDKIFGLCRVGALADGVPDETAALAEEIAGDGRLEARSFFARDIEQMLTLRDVEALSDLAGRIRARATQQTSTALASMPEAAIHSNEHESNCGQGSSSFLSLSVSCSWLAGSGVQ